MKYLNGFLIIVLVLSLSLVTLVMSIEENSYDLDYYMNSFEENGVYETTGKTPEELEKISKDIILYLKGSDDSALDSHFNQREIHHMEDVLGLFDLARVIKLVSSLLTLGIIFYFLSREKAGLMGKWILFGLFANHFILLILGILVATDFTKYFTVFHEIFFTNDLWILDPKTDLMIQMLPEPFFINIARNIGMSFIKNLAIAQFIGYVFYRKGTHKIGRFKSNKRY